MGFLTHEFSFEFFLVHSSSFSFFALFLLFVLKSKWKGLSKVKKERETLVLCEVCCIFVQLCIFSCICVVFVLKLLFGVLLFCVIGTKSKGREVLMCISA